VEAAQTLIAEATGRIGDTRGRRSSLFAPGDGAAAGEEKPGARTTYNLATLIKSRC
jgi:hypothetical protein